MTGEEKGRKLMQRRTLGDEREKGLRRERKENGINIGEGKRCDDKREEEEAKWKRKEEDRRKLGGKIQMKQKNEYKKRKCRRSGNRKPLGSWRGRMLCCFSLFVGNLVSAEQNKTVAGRIHYI